MRLTNITLTLLCIMMSLYILWLVPTNISLCYIALYLSLLAVRRWRAKDAQREIDQAIEAFKQRMILPERIQTAIGRLPTQEEFVQVNCQGEPKAGSTDHQHCGWCAQHNQPRFHCGCTRPTGERLRLPSN